MDQMEPLDLSVQQKEGKAIESVGSNQEASGSKTKFECLLMVVEDEWRKLNEVDGMEVSQNSSTQEKDSKKQLDDVCQTKEANVNRRGRTRIAKLQFRCPICSKKLPSKRDFKEHVKLDHKRRTREHHEMPKGNNS